VALAREMDCKGGDVCISYLQGRLSSLALMSYPLRNQRLDFFVKNLFCPKPLVYAALLFWLLVSVSGIHGHYCFDGKEPPVSVHSDLMSGHPEHHEDEGHVDADGDLFELLLAKLVKIDAPFLITAFVFLLTLCPRQQLFFARYAHHFTPRTSGLRPPSRAPPALFQFDF
jgi:hypothetical protein